jgi:hypothetical protein
VTSGAGVVSEGTVTFTLLNGGGTVGAPVTATVTSGTATASYTLPAGSPAGSDTIQAVYNGTAEFGGSADSSHSLAVDIAAGVGSQSSSQTVDAGASVSFTATGTGNPAPTVQWQVSTNGGVSYSNVTNGGVYAGATSNTLQINPASAAQNGYMYQAVFSNTIYGSGTVQTATTTPATLTVDSVPTIVTSPSNVTVVTGGTTTFTASATGNPAPTVQWQVSTNGGASFTNVANGGVYTGAATGTLQISNATATMNGYVYQAVFTNTLAGAGGPSTTATTSVTLTVDSAPAVATNPVSATVTAAGTTTFTAAATGAPTPAVQWQVSTNYGVTFTNLSNGPGYSGVTTPVLTITNAAVAQNGYEYQAEFSNTLPGAGSPSTATTTAATLMVDSAPAVTTNPTNVTVSAGSAATLTAAAAGYPVPAAQWQVSTDGGATFSDLTSGGPFSGVNTTTLQIANTTSAMNGDLFQAVFSNTVQGAGSPSTAGTTAAVLTVTSAPAVVTNPTAQSVLAGGSISFTAAAAGTPTPTVQWQVSTNNGVTFTNVSNSAVYSGATTDTLQIINAPAALNGCVYQAIFTNSGSATSAPATLTVNAAPTVTANPATVSTAPGGSVTFTAAAAGYPVPAVQWQVSTDGGTTFTNLANGGDYSGAGSDTLTVSGATSAMNGYEYQAVFTNTLPGSGAPSTATTSAAALAVTSPGDPTTSVVTVSGPSVQAGGSITVTLQAKNSAGQDMTTGGLTVAFALEGGGAQGTFGPVTDNANGTYSATFLGTAAGTGTVTATIGGVAVTTTPPAVTVTPAAISPATSVVSTLLPGLQLGGQTTIVLQAEDAYGNKETTGGAAVAFQLGGTGGGRGTIGAVTDNHNGTYTATFTGTVDGTNTIDATIGGVQVTSAAPAVAVSGAAFGLAKSVVTVSAASVVSGAPVQVVLQAETAGGVKETGGGLRVGFALKSGSGGQGTFGPVVDNGNGTYTTTFTGTVAGSNTITATIDGQAVTAKAPAVKVAAGAVSLATSLVTLSASTVAAGGTVTLTFQPKDAAGNKLVVSGLAVTFTPGSTSGGQGKFGAVKYNTNGTYTCTFTGTTAGANTVVVSVNGQAVSTPPPVITVTPGKASPAASFVTVSQGSIGLDGTTTVTLQAEDAYGNKETAGGLAVVFALAGKTGCQGIFSKVTDHKNGTYTAVFIGTSAGSNTITATVGGARLTVPGASIQVT